MSEAGGPGVDHLVVGSDPGGGAWTLTAPARTGGTATLAVTIGGLRWVVGAGRPASPVLVAVDRPATPFARAALEALLGPQALPLLDGEVEAGAVVPLDAGRAERRRSMGLLATAVGGRARREPFDPGRALDLAALAHRAGLDGLGPDLPQHAELAEDAAEALELLPDAVRRALADRSRTGAGWSVARAALADAVAFVGRSSEALIRGIDVDAEAARLLADLPELPDLAAQVVPADQLVDAWPEPAFRGAATLDRAPTLPVLLVDSSVRGIVSATARVARPGVVEVSVHGRVSFDRPLHARVVAADRASVVASAELRAVAGSPRVDAELVIGSDDARSVELVTDPDQPVVGEDEARRLDAASHWIEGYRLLQEQAALGDGAPAGDLTADARRHFEDALLATTELDPEAPADLRDLLPTDVEPLPSDGLAAVLAELADTTVASMEAVPDAAQRATQAQDLAVLVEQLGVPWLGALAGRLRRVEASARAEVARSRGDGP